MKVSVEPSGGDSVVTAVLLFYAPPTGWID
jgi:hypothetical protein